MKTARAWRVLRLLTEKQRAVLALALLTGKSEREALSIARTW